MRESELASLVRKLQLHAHCCNQAIERGTGILAVYCIGREIITKRLQRTFRQARGIGRSGKSIGEHFSGDALMKSFVHAGLPLIKKGYFLPACC